MASLRPSPMQRDRRRDSRTIVLLLVLVGASRAMALDIDDLRITKQGRAYQVQMTCGVAASVNQVMAVLTDYGFPDRLDPEVQREKLSVGTEGSHAFGPKSAHVLSFSAKTSC